jgi:hypothetical protein
MHHNLPNGEVGVSLLGCVRVFDHGAKRPEISAEVFLSEDCVMSEYDRNLKFFGIANSMDAFCSAGHFKVQH